jgi:hypothetical protein
VYHNEKKRVVCVFDFGGVKISNPRNLKTLSTIRIVVLGIQGKILKKISIYQPKRESKGNTSLEIEDQCTIDQFLK